jgi:hypothetical protein
MNTQVLTTGLPVELCYPLPTNKGSGEHFGSGAQKAKQRPTILESRIEKKIIKPAYDYLCKILTVSVSHR